MKIMIQLLFAIFLSFIIVGDGFAQDSNERTIYNKLMEKINLDRVKIEDYKLFLYMQKGDSLSFARILNKRISKEMFRSKLCFKITEKNLTADGVNQITAYVDADTFLPKYLEISNDGSVTNTYTFYSDKTIAHNFKGTGVEKVEMPRYDGAFLSNSFTEIVQANDFTRNKKIRYQTFNPKNKRPPNTFVAERVGDKMISLPNGHHIEGFQVKFTRITPIGKQVEAGYRYIDKDSGRVLSFEYELNPETKVAYQLLLFE